MVAFLARKADDPRLRVEAADLVQDDIHICQSMWAEGFSDYWNVVRFEA